MSKFAPDHEWEPAEDTAPDAGEYWDDWAEPAHHDSHTDCAACGARWEPIPGPGVGSSMQHKDDCAYIAALDNHKETSL